MGHIISFFTTWLIFAFTTTAVAKVCFDTRHTAVINLGFDYQNRPEFGYLPGVAKDRQTMKELFKGYSNQVNLSDQDVRTKEDFLDQFRARIAAAKKAGIVKPDVFLNYAGHGLLTANGGFAIPLPSTPKSCFEEKELEFEGQPDSTVYRGHFTSSYIEKSRGLGRISMNPCSASRGLGRTDCKDVHFKKIMTVFNDTSQSCQKYVLSSSDFETLADQVNIYGIIDSCHSGALTKTKGVNIAASAQAHEIANDDPNDGGQLFKFANDMLSKYVCTISNDPWGNLSVANLISALRPVSLTAQGLQPLESFRGLQRQELERVYFQGQTPIVSKTIADGEDLGCFPISSTAKEEANCENPFQYLHVATKSFKCTENKEIKSGESLVLVREDTKTKSYRAFTKSCGVFEIDEVTYKTLRKIAGASKAPKGDSTPDQKDKSSGNRTGH